MKRFLRRIMIVLGIGVALFAVPVSGRFWVLSQQYWDLDRARLYARALDWAVAERASPGTPAVFRHVLPFDTPVEERPPGADPQAFLGTAPAVLPCRRTAAQMRADGPGECSSIGFLYMSRDQPAFCNFVPCTVIAVPRALWEDSAVRPAFSGAGLRQRMCALRERPSQGDWFRDPRRLPDCGRWWLARGIGLIAVSNPDRDFEYDYHWLF